MSGLVSISYFDGEMIIRPRGLWKLWSFCRAKRIPVGDIESVEYIDRPRRELQPRWRKPGLGTFRSLAGYTTGPKGRMWWCARTEERAMVVWLRNNPLRAVVATVDEPVPLTAPAGAVDEQA